jgi:hypothetical protein
VVFKAATPTAWRRAVESPEGDPPRERQGREERSERTPMRARLPQPLRSNPPLFFAEHLKSGDDPGAKERGCELAHIFEREAIGPLQASQPGAASAFRRTIRILSLAEPLGVLLECFGSILGIRI